MGKDIRKDLKRKDGGMKKEWLKKIGKYMREDGKIGDKEVEQDLKGIEDKKLKNHLYRLKTKELRGNLKAVRSEILLTEESGILETENDLEKTYKVTQEQIVQDLDISTSRKRFDLNLETFGPYTMNYTRNGRHLLIGGRKGHVAAFDWQLGKLSCEIHLKETVRDVRWLHNETMFAVAQKKYVYIYDKTGLEIHRLKKHVDINRLEYLSYHFLLVSIGNTGYLKYQDTSTGELVAEFRTKLGPCSTMTQNPNNAIIQLGHGNGTVTMWSPSISSPLVKMLCHRGPVTSIATDFSGNYMVTSGLDGKMKIWDVRTYKPMQEYYTLLPASNLDISQKGLLAVGYGAHVQIWKEPYLNKQQSPYMSHLMPGLMLSDFQFCPFDDVLGIGHSRGFSSILIPGSGEANIDTFEANPYQTIRQRQESEVKMLLEKIQPEMINLDTSFIGKVTRTPKEKIEEDSRMEFEANNPDKIYQPKFKARGKSSSKRRYLKKQVNVIDANKIALREKLDKQQREHEQRQRGAVPDTIIARKSALDRFVRKKIEKH